MFRLQAATSIAGIPLTYNQHGRLASINVNGVQADYLYNALGQMIVKSVNSISTVLVYDEAGHIVGEYSPTTGLIQETVWLGDTPVATIQPTPGGSGLSIYYVHTDNLNTPRIITRPSDNTVMWAWTIDPFGTTAAAQNPEGAGNFVYNLRFPGQYYQAETGIFQNYYRDYFPSIGRYFESDPLGLIPGVGTSPAVHAYMRAYFTRTPLAKRVAKGVNQPYSYVSDNPIALFDPFGLYGTSDCSYYAQRCAQVGGVYYCNIAPAVCGAFPSTGWSACVRECLQSGDRRVCSTCKPGGGSDILCTIGEHEYCWTQCGKNPSDPPPL